MLVKADTNVINAQQKNIAGYINDFDSGISNIKNTMNDISNIWRGKDHDNFNAKMDELTNDLTSFKNTLNDYSEFLEGYTKATDILDDYYGDKTISIK